LVRLNGVNVWSGTLCCGSDCWEVRNVSRRKVGSGDIRPGHAEHSRFGRDDGLSLNLIAADFSVFVESNLSALSRQRYPFHVGYEFRFGFAVMLAHRGQSEPGLADHGG
jgi:hypothetical protein